jgi:hypothetical protein
MHDVSLSGKQHKKMKNKQIEHQAPFYFCAFGCRNSGNDKTDRVQFTYIIMDSVENVFLYRPSPTDP